MAAGQMIAKRMTKERREELLQAWDIEGRHVKSGVGLDVIRELYTDALYWREAVRKVPMSQDEIGSWCPFCEGQLLHTDKPPLPHAEDCPWLLAEEDQ